MWAGGLASDIPLHHLHWYCFGPLDRRDHILQWKVPLWTLDRTSKTWVWSQLRYFEVLWPWQKDLTSLIARDKNNTDLAHVMGVFSEMTRIQDLLLTYYQDAWPVRFLFLKTFFLKVNKRVYSLIFRWEILSQERVEHKFKSWWRTSGKRRAPEGAVPLQLAFHTAHLPLWMSAGRGPGCSRKLCHCIVLGTYANHSGLSKNWLRK